MNGALSQALGLQSDITKQASAQVAADPMAAQLAAAQAKDAEVKAAAATKIEDNIQRKSELMETPLPAAPMPEFAALPEKPKTPITDPMRVFGQFLPVLAALGGLATRNPAVNSLNAATAAINAAKSNDKEALAQAHSDWLDNLKMALAENEQVSTKYNAVLANRKMAWDEKLANIEQLAAANQDQITLAGIRSGNAASIKASMDVRDKAADKLSELVKQVEERNATSARDAESRRSHIANENIARTNAGKMSMAEVIAPLLQKMASGATLSDGEKAAVQQYKDLGGSSSGPFSGFGGGYGAPGAAAPAAPSGTQASPYKPSSKAEAAALPKGSWFTDPSGNLIQKK